METQKKLILKYSKKKNPDGHYDEILCMDIHPTKNMLLTAGKKTTFIICLCFLGKDRMIKLWDTRSMDHIHTFIRHRGTINGIKFQNNSDQFCSISCDKTMNL